MKKSILITIALLVGLAALYSKDRTTWPYNWPDFWKAQGKLHDRIQLEHSANALQTEDEIARLPDPINNRKVTDSGVLLNTVLSSADRSRDLVRIQKAGDAREADRDESVLSTEVLVSDADWSTLKDRQIRVPSIIRVVGTITPENYPGHKSGPDGIPWTPRQWVHDQTVLMEEQDQDEPTASTGELNEAIGRFCLDPHGLDCRLGFPVGSEAVICVGPGFYDGGWFQGHYNGLSVQGGVKMNLYFAGTEKANGKYKIVITPDDPPTGRLVATDICRSHPGQLIVKF